LEYHSLLNQIVSTIGENRIIQKLDIFSKKRYSTEAAKEFLQQKYSQHFDGRIYKTIDTILLITDIIDDKTKKQKNKQYNFSDKNYKELREKCQKVFLQLKEKNCDPVFMKEKDFDHYLSGILSMQFKDIPSFDNIKSTNEYLRVGKQYVKVVIMLM
jgi:predicted MPP superfamily phosphohydrolase